MGLAAGCKITYILGCAQDPVHRLAWSLDACLKDRVLDDRRMRELHQFFGPLERATAVGRGPCECLSPLLCLSDMPCSLQMPAHQQLFSLVGGRNG